MKKIFSTTIFSNPPLFINEERVETKSKTTHQSISPIHPTLTTPHNKITPIPQKTIQSTVSNLLSQYLYKWITNHIDQ